MDTRENKLARARSILTQAKSEQRELTPEEQSRFDTIMADVQLMREERHGPAMKPIPGDMGPGYDDDDNGGIPKEELARFSLGRAVLAAASGDWRLAPHEREVSDHVAKRANKATRGGINGFYWPLRSAEHRDLTVGTEGTDIVEVTHREPIDVLRAKMVTRAAGATVITGLQGDVQFPKASSSGTFGWVAEGSAPSEWTPTFGQLKLSPKTCIGFADVTRQTLLQSSFAADEFLRRDLTKILATELDKVALHGGGSNEPSGVFPTSGIGDVIGGTNGAAPTWVHITELEEDVAVANADVGNLAYITNAKVRRKLKNTEKVSTTGLFVWQDPANLAPATPGTPLNGYRAFVTNQVASNLVKGTYSSASAIFFGNWEELIVAHWSDIDILVDPYTASSTGTVRIIAYLSADVGLRHPESFSCMKDAITT